MHSVANLVGAVAGAMAQKADHFCASAGLAVLIRAGIDHTALVQTVGLPVSQPGTLRRCEMQWALKRRPAVA